MKEVKLQINSHTLREQLVQALGMSGRKVYATEDPDYQYYRGYYVHFEVKDDEITEVK